MKGAIIAMKTTEFEPCTAPRLPKKVQLARLKAVIERELTERERQILLAVYRDKQTITQIAQAEGVNKSTICRTLHRAEDRLRRYLRY